LLIQTLTFLLLIMNSLKIFSGDSNPSLVTDICSHLSISPGEIYRHSFPNGESYVQFHENIRGSDVFLVQSFSLPANDRVMQLLIMADAARRASAGRITAVIPYFGYARQDRKEKSRVPISAKLVMDLIAAAGIDRVVTMDLHSPQVAGFTNLPFDHLYGSPSLIEAIKLNEDVSDLVVVSPDTGAIKRSMYVADLLKAEFAFINKKRLNDSVVRNENIVGDVKDKNVLLLDDMTESCGTLIEAARTCKNMGCKNVYAAVTHALFNETAAKRLSDRVLSPEITALYYTNTTVRNFDIDSDVHLARVNVAPVFAKAIQCIHNDESVTDLFSVKGY
jgi:ribose-phosphate pyrophosphokinase